MIEWFYFSFGMALVFILMRRGRKETAASIFIFSFKTWLALIVLLEVHALLNFYLWAETGREDLGLATLFLLAMILDEGIQRLGKKESKSTSSRLLVSPSYLALTAFSLWIITGSEKRILAGLCLPPATALFEWFLEGLRTRLRLSNIPRVLEGEPILFWLGMTLFLGFWGFLGAGRTFVN